MKIDTTNSAMKTQVLYHDNAALANIKHSTDSQTALKEVAGQFEAMFLQMVLRQMRSSSDVLADEDSPFSSQQQGVFRDMHDGQLSIELARKQHSGIADMLVKQLSPSHAEVQFDTNSALAMASANDLEASSQALPIENNKVASEVNAPPGKVAFTLQSPQESATTMAFSQPLMRTTERELL
ncbi:MULTISPECIES: rod-binding protein [Vibrio]|uniref:rod-binding protein n=1 Tax=Vibrio TaxID=662 RepID=UPI003D0D9253